MLFRSDAANKKTGATVFGYYVDDPERFGVVEFDENGLVIDVYVSIKVGYAINEVAEKIQKNIHLMIYHMTSVKTSEIYVHVVSIDFD